MRLACAGDIHLDERATAGGKLLLGPNGRNVRAVDRERCLEAFVTGAIERECDAALISGDLFDRARPSPTEYVAAERALDRLCQQMPCCIVGDNHGLPQSPLEAHALAPLIGRHRNLHVLLEPQIMDLRTEAGLLQIAGLPWPRRAVLAAKEETSGLSPEALNALISQKLALIVQSLRARRIPGIPCVLLGHVMLREAVFSPGETAPDPGHIMLCAQDLAGFDAAVLGDIHRAQSFDADGRIFYTGSTDQVSFNEEAEAKGWWLMTLDGERFTKALIETPARKYLTYRNLDEAKAESFVSVDLATDPVVRVKATVTQEEYDALAPDLSRWRRYPLFIEELEITRQTTARSKEMQGDLAPEAALRLWHEVNQRPEDLGMLVEEHRRLIQGLK